MKRMTVKQFGIMFLALLGAALVVAGCGGKKQDAAGGGTGAANASQPPAVPVDVAPVKTGNIAQTISVTGNLATLFSVDLSPKTAGRLVNVSVREGDVVHAGQVLAQVDPTSAEADVRQDQANVLSSQAKVGQAVATYNQSILTTQASIQNAKAALVASQANYTKTKTGGQPQEKAQAQDQLLQQQANYNNALTAFNREQELYNQGAVAKADLDNAETTYKVQKALLDSYQQNESMALEGGRPEDVQSAYQQVVQSQANLRNAKANQANIAVNKQAVVAAQAALAQSQAALVSAEQSLADTNLVTPINGVVAARNQDPGTIASPGTTVVQVVDLSTMYYEPTVSETDFRHIAPGQLVDISVDAFPGRDFTGKVTDIYPSASTTNRQFSIRVSIPNATKELRPGMYARGAITVVQHTGAVIIPISAMMPRATQVGFQANQSSNGLATGSATLPPQMVYLAGSDGKAHEQDIEVGIVTTDTAEVTSGLKPGDQLIVKGQGEIQDGDPVKVSGQGGHGHHKGAGASGAGADGQTPAS